MPVTGQKQTPDMTKSEAITLGADVGGKDAHEATRISIHTLRRLLALECIGPYSAKIDEYALVLRIDGEVQSWGRRGTHGIILSERWRRVTTDIYVPSTEWSGSGTNFAEFLADEVTKALSAICAKAKTKWSDFDPGRMTVDVARAIDAFRAES